MAFVRHRPIKAATSGSHLSEEQRLAKDCLIWSKWQSNFVRLLQSESFLIFAETVLHFPSSGRWLKNENSMIAWSFMGGWKGQSCWMSMGRHTQLSFQLAVVSVRECLKPAQRRSCQVCRSSP